MSTSVARQSFIPQEQYLVLERKAEYKSEYINGQIYAMVGASREHTQIAFNVAGQLYLQLRGRACVAYTIDMRVKVDPTGMYTYPDVSALCGEPLFEDTQLDTLLNPSVIIEVLSPSTEAYDRGDKFAHYRRLPSLTDYVLISQNKARVEQYVRQGEQWVLTEFSTMNATLQLVSIDCRLSLQDIYDKVEFSGEGKAGPARGDDHR